MNKQSFKLLKNTGFDNKLLKQNNIEKNKNESILVRGDLIQNNINQKNIIQYESSIVESDIKQDNFLIENLQNQTKSQQNILKQNDVTFINSDIITSQESNSIGISNNKIQINADQKLVDSQSISFNVNVDYYKETKIIKYDRQNKKFKIIDENENNLKLYFDPSYITNIFLKKTGGEMLGVLLLKDISNYQVNPNIQQNIKYFKNKIESKYYHFHTEYISINGEYNGSGEGTILNHILLSNEPVNYLHQQTKKYIDDTTILKITELHPKYISRTEDDQMDENSSLQLKPDVLPNQLKHAQTLKYLNDTITYVIQTHNHDSKYIKTTSEDVQDLQRIPRLHDDFVLKPNEINTKYKTHIQSKQYQDFLTQKNINGSLFISYQHYYTGTCFSKQSIIEDETVDNGLYRLTFDFTDWYNEFNQAYKLQMDTVNDFNTSDFIIIPIITPNSFEIPTSEFIDQNENREWFTNDPYYDIVIDNITYPNQNKNYIVSFDIGIIPIDETGSRTLSSIQVEERENIPMQSFTIMFIGGPINLVFNSSEIPQPTLIN